MLWAELHESPESPREAELFGIWLRPRAHLVQRLGLYFCTDFLQEAETEARRRWEAAQQFLLGCIASSTSLRGLALGSKKGELRADTWCAGLPSLRWVGRGESSSKQFVGGASATCALPSAARLHGRTSATVPMQVPAAVGAEDCRPPGMLQPDKAHRALLA